MFIPFFEYKLFEFERNEKFVISYIHPAEERDLIIQSFDQLFKSSRNSIIKRASFKVFLHNELLL